VAFDLGVMAVAAQAQQQTQTLPVRTPTTTMGPTFPGPDAAAAPVWDENGTTDCTNGGRPGAGGRPTSCGPAAISDQAAQGNLSAVMPSAQPQFKSKSKSKSKGVYTMDLKIDRVNTIQACRARQGEVVREQGVQLCRMPVSEAPAVGNPTLPRAGGIPPR
jgi:hypothetical protein